MQIDQRSRRMLIAATVSGALAVALGAFGAHGLKPLLVENGRLDAYGTAVEYHFYHTLALLGTGILHVHLRYKWLPAAALLFQAGTLLFSGSLYLLSIWRQLSFLGPVTPLGGILLICGWLLLGFSLIQRSS